MVLALASETQESSSILSRTVVFQIRARIGQVRLPQQYLKDEVSQGKDQVPSMYMFWYVYYMYLVAYQRGVRCE